MPLDFFLVQLLNGVSYGLLLFMLAAGLTLIFSMMGVLNFAHTSFYMLGAYTAFQLSQWLGFWLALVVAPLIVGLLVFLVRDTAIYRDPLWRESLILPPIEAALAFALRQLPDATARGWRA